ncbi:Ubiquitin conjugation factor E4 B [Babesia sp. Xinjiang]|uniref:Ubiquitin conjugation factor E4 B n=1 Tax=Babesia sp. Xinjiang TaxID=462227 RepID=UPI000A266A7D|nr:Ubiquitin conjugation factor E4 B [Babesia sp. Xinjiang]ORM39590.1 Ubiquitin conjugation factor E4 B [Babesia sp. Xinjiang]
MGSAAVVDHVVKHVLGVALKKSERTPPSQRIAGVHNERLYVGQFYTRITGVASTEDVTINMDGIDDVARSAVFACILHNRNPLTLMSDAFTRGTQSAAHIEAERNPFDMPELTQGGKLQKDAQVYLRQLIANIIKIIVANSALLMVCPMFFNLEDLVAKEDLKKEPLDVADDNVRSNMLTETLLPIKNASYVQHLLTEMWNNDEKVTTDEMYRVFTQIKNSVIKRPIGEKPLAEIAALTNLVGIKIGASLFVRWVREHETIKVSWKTSGVQRDVTSLMGRILSSPPLNEETINSATMMTSDSAIYEKAQNFRKLHFHGRKDVTSIRSSLASVRQEHEAYIELVANFLKTILRTDFKTRKELLVLVGQLVGFNSTKRNISRITHVDQPPITLDDNFSRRQLLMPDSTFGTSLNIMWLMLVLASGITEKKLDSIDPNFCQIGFYTKHKIQTAKERLSKDEEFILYDMAAMRTVVDGMIGFISSGNAGMGDETQLIEVLEKQNFDVKAAYNAKFITQIFWGTLHALGMLYLPSIQEFLKLIIFTVQAAQASADPLNDTIFDLLSHVFIWRCVMQHKKFLEALWHYINISLQFFLRCALLSRMETIQAVERTKLEGTALCVYMVNQFASGKLQGSDEMTPEFTVLPVEFIDIVLDVIKQLFIMHYYVDHIKPEDVEVFEFMDFELVIATCIFMMKAPQMTIKNLTLKCDTVSSIVLHLCKSAEMASFATSQIAKQHLVDALTNVFIASQRADYNSRVSCRLNVIQTLTKLFEIEVYKRSFVTHSLASKDVFVQFMHLLLNDTSFIFEEVVTFLSEIRRRELAGITDEQPERERQNDTTSSNNRAAGQEQGESERQGQRADDEPLDPSLQDGNIDPNQLKSMNFEELKRRTRSLVEYGSEITNLLHILCREFHNEITNLAVLLPQMASCLGCCLDNLAGESCTKLKVKNMMEYEFKPKEWLTNIVNCYLALYGGENPQNAEPFMKALVSEGRYFKPINFERAYRIITREMLLTSKDRRAFFNMSQKLCMYAKANSNLYQSALEAEMPEEFLDPIMNDIMEDPVLLPTSGIVMDRKNIERHLMSEATDPFSRQPLIKADLVPQEELKRRIDEFMASVSHKGGGADDFYQS